MASFSRRKKLSPVFDCTREIRRFTRDYMISVLHHCKCKRNHRTALAMQSTMDVKSAFTVRTVTYKPLRLGPSSKIGAILEELATALRV